MAKQELIDYEFQRDAEEELTHLTLATLNSKKHITAEDGIVLEAIVGSGKTKMLHQVMENIGKVEDDVAFVFLTKSSGNLVGQTLSKMRRYGENIIKFYDVNEFVSVSGSGVKPNTCAVVGWDKLNQHDKTTGKAKNIQMKESSETINFRSVMVRNKDGRFIRIVVIIDEAHCNFGTISSQEIMELIYPFASILSTATPKMSKEIFSKSKQRVIVDAQAVAEAGKIKRELVINDGSDGRYEDLLHGDYSNKNLMRAALKRRELIEEQFRSIGLGIVPGILIQVENDIKNKVIIEKTVDTALADAKELGYDMDRTFVWTADSMSKELSARLNALDYSEDYAIITKIAPSEGWDCQRFYIIVKLRPQSGSETLDAQIAGRVFRTADPYEWLVNEAYRENDMLNAAFIYCNEELYDIDLIGLNSVSAKKTVRGLKDGMAEKLAKIHLYKEIAGAKRAREDTEKNKIKDGIKSFLADKIPYGYRNGAGAWAEFAHVAYANVAKDQLDSTEVEDQIAGSSKTKIANVAAEIPKEEIEESLVRRLAKTPNISQYVGLIKKAILEYHDEVLYPDAERGSMNRVLDRPEYERRLQDLMCAIYNRYPEFLKGVSAVLEKCATYQENLRYDGSEGHPLWTPPTSISVSTKLIKEYEKKPVEKRNAKAWEKTYAYDAPVPSYSAKTLDSQQEDEFMRKFLGQMDWWIKNGTHTTPDWCLTRGQGHPKHHRTFPDFLCQKDGCLFVFEVKGKHNEAGVNETYDAIRDKEIAEALTYWMGTSEIMLTSVIASEGVDEICGGVVKQIGGIWYVYLGSGDNFDECNVAGGEWMEVDKFIAKKLSEHESE